MIAYLDASVLVPLVVVDAHNERALAVIRRHNPTLIVSDFAAAEFASAIARRVRSNDLTRSDAQSAFTTFDSWSSHVTRPVQTASADLSVAAGWIRWLDLNLRAPDAINIAIARRIGAEPFTFDLKMAEAAAALGVSVRA